MFHGRNTNSEYVFQPLNISSNIFERHNIPSISRISVASISISRSTSHNNPSLHNIVTIRTDRLTDRDRRREDAITRAKRWKKENEEGPLPPLDRLYRNRIVSTDPTIQANGENVIYVQFFFQYLLIAEKSRVKSSLFRRDNLLERKEGRSFPREREKSKRMTSSTIASD